jgi:hypothetical protein
MRVPKRFLVLFGEKRPGANACLSQAGTAVVRSPVFRLCSDQASLMPFNAA